MQIMKPILYHNPHCSKSKKAVELLTEKGVELECIEYLKTPPTNSELTQILTLLKIDARALMRKGEKIYSELNLDNESLTEDELINAMIENPILIERPILIINQEKAMIGRPPETLLTMID